MARGAIDGGSMVHWLDFDLGLHRLAAVAAVPGTTGREGWECLWGGTTGREGWECLWGGTTGREGWECLWGIWGHWRWYLWLMFLRFLLLAHPAFSCHLNNSCCCCCILSITVSLWSRFFENVLLQWVAEWTCNLGIYTQRCRNINTVFPKSSEYFEFLCITN